MANVCKILKENGLLYALFVKGKSKQLDPQEEDFPKTSGQMHVSSPDKKVCIDVWVSCFINDDYYSIQNIYKIMKKSDVVPLTVGSIRGIEFKVPKDSEKILKHLYGEDWHIPQKKKPVTTKRQLWEII